MGLFSSKTITKVTVSSVASRAIEDRYIPNSKRIGLIKGVLKGEQLVEYVMEEVVGSIGMRAERMYEFGKSKYVNGLPWSSVRSNSEGNAVVKAVIESELGYPIEVEYSNYAPLNNLHYGWDVLTDAWGYDHLTNQLNVLSAQKGTPVYLKDMVVVVSDATIDEMSNGSLAQWGVAPTAGVTPQRPYLENRAHSPYLIEPIVSSDFLRVTYCWNSVTPYQHNGNTLYRTDVEEESFTIPVVDEHEDGHYFQVKYRKYEAPTTILNPNGTPKQFPVLDSNGNQVYSLQRGTGIFYYDLVSAPVYETRTTTINNNPYVYWTYLEKSGQHIELDELYDPKEPTLGSFFPIAHFRNGRTSMATDPNSRQYKDNTKLLKYLGMDFADIAEAIHQNPDIQYIEQAALLMAVPPTSGNAIEQRYLFDFFKRLHVSVNGLASDISQPQAGYGLVFNNVFKETEYSFVIADNITSMSLRMTELSKQFVSGSIGEIGTYTCGTGSVSKDLYVGGTELDEVGNATESVITKTLVRGYHYYKKQITASIYEEIRVYGLTMSVLVDGGYSATDVLLIPLDHSITEEYTISEREELYARSLHYLFTTKVVTEQKVKWYQQAWFRVVLIIIAIVLTILDLGSDGGTWIGLATAISELTLEQVVMAIIIYAVEYIVISAAIKLFVKVLGADVAMILAVVAIIYGGYQAIQAGGLNGAPWAKELISLGTNLAKAAYQDKLTNSLLGIQKEEALLEMEYDEKFKFLKAKEEELLGDDPIFATMYVPGEDPATFFYRTCHAGNIGTVCFDALHSYVDDSLKLPEFKDTIRMLEQPRWT